MKRQTKTKAKLSLHVNRAVSATIPDRTGDSRPSIVQVSDPPLGLVEIKIRDFSGSRIGFVQVVEEDLDDELVDALRAWQARHAHGPSLHISQKPKP